MPGSAIRSFLLISSVGTSVEHVRARARTNLDRVRLFDRLTRPATGYCAMGRL